jgi:2'-5' RNA ligase
MQKHYQKMWQQGIVAYQQQQFFIDKNIGDATDTRRGITLLARLSLPVQEHVRLFLNELANICPNQYYYPEPDMHLTIMSIVSCRQGYMFDENKIQKYMDVLASALAESPKLMVNFSGITASNTGVMLAGHTDKVQLEKLRCTIRTTIKNSGLEHSMDSRYKIETAHSTIMRFTHPVKETQQLLKFLQENHHRQFGEMQVNSLELVFNDWYQTQAQTKLVGKINLI